MRAFHLLQIFNIAREEQLGGDDMIIGSSQASLMISALKRKQGTDLLSAPRVTVMDGQSATITVAQEFIYPIDYELPEPPTTTRGRRRWERGNYSSLCKPVFDVVNPPDEQPGFREVGVVLNVTPTIEKYNSINLRLNPKSYRV